MKSRYIPARARLTRFALAASLTLFTSNVVISATASAATQAPADHTLNLSFLQDPGQPPDPDVFYGTQGLVLTTNLYQGLLTFKAGTATAELAPELATSWTHSANNKVFTFKLRKGVTFHDGTPFTSAAIEPSFARRLAVDQGPAYMVQDVASVTTHGKYAATIKLKSPNSNFLDELASPYGPKMMSPTALKADAGKDHDQTYLRDHDIGTGPYTLTEAKTGSLYQVKAYSHYWGKKAYFTTVDFPVITDSSTEQLQFQSGSLAAILHDLPSSADASYAKNSKYATYSLPTEESDYLYVNPHTPAMSSLKVRRALLRAIDLKTLVKDAYFGRGTLPTQIYAAGISGPQYSRQKISFDPSALKAAVASLPADDRTVTIGYDSSSPDDQQVANLMVGMLAAGGLTAKVQAYPSAEIFGWVGNHKNTPDMLVDLGFPDAPTPYLWEHINFDPSGGVNFFGCSSPAATKLLAQGLKTGSPGTFSEAAEDAQATGCWMNLVDVSDFMVAQPWLKGISAAHVATEPTSLELNELYR